MERRSRQYLNTVKGVAVILMLWGHCIQYCSSGSFNCFDDAVYQAIYSFHMPLFMLVSGYLFYFSFRKRDWKTLMVRRIQSMAQPIILGTILCNLLVQIMHLVLGRETQFFNGALFSGMSLYWFLWCVLSSSLVVGTVFKLVKAAWQRAALLVLAPGFLAVFPEMNMHLFMYPFFLAGFLWAKHRGALTQKLGKLRYVSLLLFPLLLGQYDYRHFIYITPIYSPEYGLVKSMEINLLRFAIGFAGSIVVLTVIGLAFDWMAAKNKQNSLVNAVSKLGEASLQIYCLSAPLLSVALPTVYGKVVQVMGGNVFAENMAVFHGILMPLLTAAYAAGLYALVQLMKKMKIHTLVFGR